MRAIACRVLLVILLTSCAPPSPPTVARLADDVFLVAFPLRYTIADTQDSVVVPVGFLTDLASIPKALHWWEGKVDRSMAGAIIHDYLYWDQRCTKDEADAVLYLAMTEAGVSNTTRNLVYRGVRTPFADSAHRGNAERKARGEARFFSESHVRRLLDASVQPEATLKSLQDEAIRAGGVATDVSNPAIVKACATALRLFKNAG